ncbi:uncharacterized protein ACOB8E_006683 isoform 1-T1 [Sarcophilus harrisii]
MLFFPGQPADVSLSNLRCLHRCALYASLVRLLCPQPPKLALLAEAPQAQRSIPKPVPVGTPTPAAGRKPGHVAGLQLGHPGTTERRHWDQMPRAVASGSARLSAEQKASAGDTFLGDSSKEPFVAGSRGSETLRKRGAGPGASKGRGPNLLMPHKAEGRKAYRLWTPRSLGSNPRPPPPDNCWLGAPNKSLPSLVPWPSASFSAKGRGRAGGHPGPLRAPIHSAGVEGPRRRRGPRGPEFQLQGGARSLSNCDRSCQFPSAFGVPKVLPSEKPWEVGTEALLPPFTCKEHLRRTPFPTAPGLLGELSRGRAGRPGEARG